MARSRNTVLRQKILSSAWKMFYQRGVDRVTMKDIAAACDISTSLLQHYFPKKEIIIMHLCSDLMQKIHLFIQDEVDDSLFDGQNKAAILFGLYYRLFYDVLVRENNRILHICTPILYSAPLLKTATDFIFDMVYSDTDLKGLDTEEYRFEIHLLNGGLSQTVNIYLNSDFHKSMQQYLDILFRSYYNSLGFTQAEQQTVSDVMDNVLTKALRDRFYIKYLSEITDPR